MIHMTLTGTDKATACGITRKGRGMSGPIGPLCRDLIAAGYAAHDILQISRDGKPAFAPTPLQYFAERTCGEGSETPLRFSKFTAFERNEE